MSNEQRNNVVAENMRAKGAAEFMQCGLSTVWLWAKQGKIKAYKISDRVTILNFRT